MLNVAAIFEDFGGIRPLHEALAEQWGDRAPPLDTVRKWKERNSVPGEHLIAVLAVRELRAGRPVSVHDFLAGDVECANLKKRPTLTGAALSVFD